MCHSFAAAAATPSTSRPRVATAADVARGHSSAVDRLKVRSGRHADDVPLLDRGDAERARAVTLDSRYV